MLFLQDVLLFFLPLFAQDTELVFISGRKQNSGTSAEPRGPCVCFVFYNHLDTTCRLFPVNVFLLKSEMSDYLELNFVSISCRNHLEMKPPRRRSEQRTSQ